MLSNVVYRDGNSIVHPHGVSQSNCASSFVFTNYSFKVIDSCLSVHHRVVMHLISLRRNREARVASCLLEKIHNART